MINRHRWCLICSSTNLEAITGYEKAYLCKCRSCNFVFSELIPSEDELISHYQGYGRDDYLSPITIKRYNELLDEFERFRTTNKLLDVGCGIGYFLLEAKKRGWEVYGTEYTDNAIEICENNGFIMHKGAINVENYDVQFDVITSFEVMEHINNPIEEVVNFHSLLRLGGLFYCTTPNFNSFSRKILQAKWNNICYPEHLSYYTVSSLTKLLKNGALIPYKQLTTGISISRFKSSAGLTYQKNIAIGSDDELLRNKMDKKWLYKSFKVLVNWFLTVFRLGDTIKIYSVKNN